MKIKRLAHAIFTLTCAVTVLMSLVACDKSQRETKKVGQSFDVSHYGVTVIGAYFPTPVIVTGQKNILIVKVRLKNKSGARQDVDPTNLFSLKDGSGKICPQETAQFASLKGYIEKSEQRDGQLAFAAAQKSGVYTLSAGDTDVKIDTDLPQIKNAAPLPEYRLQEEVRIDQLVYTVASADWLSLAPEGGSAGKKYLKIFLHVRSVSAGAPSAIGKRQFFPFSGSGAALTVFDCGLPEMLDTNLSVLGSITVAADAEEPSSNIVLGLSRHISGQDYCGVKLVSRTD